MKGESMRYSAAQHANWARRLILAAHREPNPGKKQLLLNAAKGHRSCAVMAYHFAQKKRQNESPPQT
jgi:hypothetical protein